MYRTKRWCFRILNSFMFIRKAVSKSNNILFYIRFSMVGEIPRFRAVA